MIHYNIQAAAISADLIIMLKHILLMQTLRIQIILMKRSKSITQLATIMISKTLIIKKIIQQLTLHYQNLFNTDMNINNTVKSILFKMHCLLIYRHKK